MSSRSSSVRTEAGSGGSMDAVHVLAAARVIPEDDNEKKPLWRYVQTLENTRKGKGGNKRSMCRLCEYVINGSYSRVKAHLLKIPNMGVSSCQKVTVDVLVQLKGEQKRADALIESNKPREIPLPTEGFGANARKKRGGNPIEACFDMEARNHLDALIARMFYTAGIPFNVARNPWFRAAFIFAAGHANSLAGYAPPSYDKLRTTLLVQERTHVDRMLMPIKSTWSSKGVTIVSDGWSDPQRRPLLNFMAITEDGPMFLRSINTEGEVKSKEYIRDRLCEIIEAVGPANVVQVITDNASNCRGAGLLVQERYNHIFWTACVVHTLNLALKSIGSATSQDDPLYDHCNWISEIAADGFRIKHFIMSHSMRLSMFNASSKLKLLAVADTRFASQVVMLKRLVQIRQALTMMVVGPKWNDYRNDNVEGARFVKEKILDDDWWNKVEYFIEFAEPIYSMIRAADTDKPCLHLTYEMWDMMIEKVKEVIYRKEGLEPHEESPFFSAVNDVLIFRWTKSSTPLHCLAHSLNPKYYTTAWISEVPGRQAPHMDQEISDERNACFRRFFPHGGPEMNELKQQFANFSLMGPGFNGFDSIEDRSLLEPKQWWGIHGNSAPALRTIALKLLGQPTSSSCSERNWSTYGMIHNTLRNRLNPARAEDLVFVHQNLRLISRKSPEYISGPSRFWDIGGDRYELFVGGADFLQQAELSLDEPELEDLLNEIEALDVD
ncbi:uncharacterized protein [Triticum aestivum]|uniref:uncharacterized protein n=1 Tax=Triticum aestivum TaxID=4565 RepID=UPI001D003372|nr:uncharacterized protein LOC123091932 [Triticum aestivum]XP_044369484.1 uncharacterized protein LOC123091932 [Triticum aestivum]XP_044369485.1 uncharacterized protein LOC123091932 [Triticum aestivum]XP_044369486.1 uncharacterized protein LOC123091932 [Triticum aestivum]XP_044369487.1 uncharacterized protein LOC123091932 [Triticum aestivum]XP_044369488.1 uncharacterized protein LOC123091932 [Triticum aestivum]XP_044369489.1 uncharacterized protein LOC123091932 [Triticum aestivum]XP_04436949